MFKSSGLNVFARHDRMGAKENNGFTLVEVIVVLVILAVLASVAIPAMTGWIDKAKEKRLIVACRTCVTAAQTLASEQYGVNGSTDAPDKGEVLALAGLAGEVTQIELDKSSVSVDALTYAAADESVTYLRLPTPHYVFGYTRSFSRLTDLTAVQEVLITAGTGTAGTLDSGAEDLGGATDRALAAFKEKGIDLQAMGAVSWRYEGNNKTLYWTDVDIRNLPAGTPIPVMRYNFNTGTYTVWQATTATLNTAGTPYNIIVNGNNFKSSTDNAAEQTYEKMVVDYQALKGTL